MDNLKTYDILLIRNEADKMAEPYYLSISESGYMFTQPNQDPDYARAIIEVFIR